MNRKHYIVLPTWMLFAYTVLGSTKIKVGLIVNNKPDQSFEIEALAKILDAHSSDVTYKLTPLTHLTSLKEFDVVWYHCSDSTAIRENEKALGKQFIDYVSNGGQLILSMDAVRLLNEWSIEPATIQIHHYAAVDEGFGRKLGFHAFRSHPLFDKLFGGAYTWHGKKDNTCRILGFFGDSQPEAKNTHIIATLWEYIFYHPNDKVIWQTSVGKGRILAIGACLYFGKPNFNEPVLRQFTMNCLNFMKGKKTESKVRFWNYQPTRVLSSDKNFSSIKLSNPVSWKIPETTNILSRRASNYNYDLSSQRTLVLGKEKAGIDEIWTHPFMSLRDFVTHLDIGGQDSLVSLSDYTPLVKMRPNAMIRTYQIGAIVLKEIITSKITDPVVVVHYEWIGDGLNRIVTDFKSNLRYMWPYDSNTLGSIYYNWSNALNAFVVMDKNQEFCSLVGSNVKGALLTSGRFDRFNVKNKESKGEKTEKLQVASSVSYDIKDKKAIDIFMVAGNTGAKSVIKNYKLAMHQPNDIMVISNAYYENYLSKKLSIITPDKDFNEGYKWAVLRSCQFIVNTPEIGTSLMAGYSSSKTGWGGSQTVSGRPGYAWYFGRDAVWSSFAFNDLGDFETVKDVLKTFIHYQAVNGKIYHELTTSGSVHYDASDATPLFVILMAKYLKSSGDISFIKENIGAIHKAMDYCYSTDTDGDHLIEINNVGHGWLEGGALYGSKTEFYLAGLWDAALEDAAYLSKATGNDMKQAQYTNDAKTVNRIINTDFWNPKGYYNYRKKADGTYTNEFIVLPTVPVYFGVTDSAKSLEMVKQFGSSSFSTDWGVRMIEEQNPLFDPAAYHFGSVWPLFTGWTALAEYQTERYIQGFAHIMSNLINYKNFSLGCVPEVLNGLVYKPGGVTLHQCWSETMVIQPTIEGLLGFRPDALRKTTILAPRFPFDWDSCKVKNLCIGDARVAFEMKKEHGKTSYTFSSTQPVKILFQPTFAPGTQITSLTIDGSKTTYEKLDDPKYFTFQTVINLQKQAVIEIDYNEGASALPSVIEPQKGGHSSGFRILEQHLVGNVLEISLEGRPNHTYPIDLYLPDGYSKIEGNEAGISRNKSVYTATVSFDTGAMVYSKTKIKVYINR